MNDYPPTLFFRSCQNQERICFRKGWGTHSVSRGTDEKGGSLGHPPNVWRKIKEAASEVSGKATIGLGVGGKIKVGPGEAKLEAAVKVNTSISAKGKVSVSQSVEIGASIGSKGRKVGLGIEAEQVKGSVDLKTGEVKGPEPATGEILVGRSNGNSTSSKGSEGGQSLGLEEGELALAGLEVSITKEGVDAFKDALHDLKDTLFPAPPPAPPAPAGPAGP